MAEETALGGVAREFPATRWTLILAAQGDPAARRRAMGELLAVYWKPLYFFVRRRGMSVEFAKDVIQDFCAHLLGQDVLARVDPSRGRFRSYLRASMDHFLANRAEREGALKRGGGARTVPLDFDVAERDLASAPDAGDAAFDREWAIGVMERAMTRLRGEFEDGTRKGSLDVALRHFQAGDAPSYADSARACGMLPVQFKAFLHRTRDRFRALLREEVGHTLPDSADVDDEIGYLMKALGP